MSDNIIPDSMKLPENSILNEKEDAALIKGIYDYANKAGLGGNPRYIWESTKGKDYFTEEDWELAQIIPNLVTEQGAYGVVYINHNVYDIPKKFMAFTGLMVRHYANARYVQVSQLLNLLVEKDAPDNRIIFIPDFCGNAKSGEEAHTWKKDTLMGYLLSRQSLGYPVVISAKSMTQIKKVYGADITNFLNTNYLTVEG